MHNYVASTRGARLKESLLESFRIIVLWGDGIWDDFKDDPFKLPIVTQNMVKRWQSSV